GPDQLQSATAAPGGKFYAAGFAAQTLTGARFVTVVKYGATGLDTTFGTNGVVTTTVDFKGGSDEIDITTQPDGKLLVSATVAGATNPADRDVAVFRLLDTGAIDTTFGTNGLTTFSFNDAFDAGTMLIGTDAPRGLTADATGIFVHGIARAFGELTPGNPRQDTDFAVAKLDLTGNRVTTFGEQDGQFRLDIGKSTATARGIKVLPDGKLLAGGYANSPGLGTTQPVLYKLTAEGKLDTTFAAGGLFHDTVLAVQTEVYNFAVHGDKIVTTGYGREVGATNDFISLRFELATGMRDMTWGGAAKGAVLFDPSGTMLGSNCRSGLALPDGKTLMIGSIGPGNMPAQDAVFAVLDASGKLDTAYGTGVHKFVLGANGNDQFWGGAVSGDQVSVVGYKGGGAAQTEASNDDAFAAVFTLR
ncbi:MAG: hypothetical protein H7138_13025, partial [Myxococcales bacterium]|nr:hypothetical protein [Myxococcales bacterium]